MEEGETWNIPYQIGLTGSDQGSGLTVVLIVVGGLGETRIGQFWARMSERRGVRSSCCGKSLVGVGAK